MSRLQLAIQQIEDSRRYTKMLLAKVDDADWFRMPPAGISHIGWQIGHLIMAEYRLTLARLRKSDSDAEWYPMKYLELYGKAGKPNPDPAANPTVSELKADMDRVHERIMTELATFPESQLDEPVEIAHLLYKTKIESLSMCARHEMLHCGQIGLLRRELGYDPAW